MKKPLLSLGCLLVFCHGVWAQEATLKPTMVQSELTVYLNHDQFVLDLSIPYEQLHVVYDLPGDAPALDWANQVLTLLANAPLLWSFPSQAECEWIDQDIQAPMLAQIVQSGNGWQDTAEWETGKRVQAHYFYQCQSIQSLTHLQVLVFQYFPQLPAIRVRVKTGRPERHMMLTPKASLIEDMGHLNILETP